MTGVRARRPLSAAFAGMLVLVLASATASGTDAVPAPDADTTGVVPAPEYAPFEYHVVTEGAALEAGTEFRVSRAGGGPTQAASPPARRKVWTVSALTDSGLPRAAERAYRRAAAGIAETDPACRLPWTLLAGVGRVESDHGRYDGARLGADGVSRPRIFGVPLDGKGPVAAIADTDRGRLDGDRVWDRAVGPMQFIPSTWSLFREDGDGDGRADPHDLDDAAAAAATYLCSGSGSLLDPGARAAAIFRYNPDDYYVALVQAFEAGYRTGVFVMPPPPPTEEERAERRRQRRAAKLAEIREERRERRRAAAATRKGQEAVKTSSPAASPKPSPSPTPKPSPKPSPNPSPKPSPSTKPEPEPYEKTGELSACDGGYCLAGELLDLGAVAKFSEKAAGDYDLDGGVETNGEEVEGLLGMGQVTMVVVKMESGQLGIYSINGKPLA